MTEKQWDQLLCVIRGERITPLPVGLIIDSPWLPNWAGMRILDYFASDPCWLDSNLKLVRQFPSIIFLPGFWSEYGMCTEPSAFGAKCIWFDDAFPSVGPCLSDHSQIRHLTRPDCRSDGLLPFVVRRLTTQRKAIEKAGQRITMAGLRGPLNIASYLLGHTQFLMGIKTHPEETHSLLRIITDFLVDWIGYQCTTIDSIDGILLLDDLIGMLSEADFKEFALPYLGEIFHSCGLTVRALHNDAAGLITAKHLEKMGVNLFNFSFQHSVPEIRALAGESVVLLGNVPPRDVLAQGTVEDVAHCVSELLDSMPDPHRLILSCGGGTSPGTPSTNLDALLSSSRHFSRRTI